VRVGRLAAALREHAGREGLSVPASAVPAPPEAAGAALLPADLLLLKKFLAGCRELAGLLPRAALDELGAEFVPGDIEDSLGLPPGDGVYFEDAASEELARTRAKIREADARMAEIEAEARARLKGEAGLDFGTRDFLVVGEERARELDRSAVTVSACDSRSAAVRPDFGEEHARLASARARAVEDERRLVTELLEDIRRRLDARRYELEACAAALCDVRAALASLRTAESGDE
jgi:hypothetical protein